MYRSGACRNLAGVVAVADHFDASVGILVKATRRVIRGLNRLAPDTILFPNAARCWDLSAWAESRFGLEGCIGATDGTTSLWRINWRGIRGRTTT